jgi:O-antigen ligase
MHAIPASSQSGLFADRGVLVFFLMSLAFVASQLFHPTCYSVFQMSTIAVLVIVFAYVSFFLSASELLLFLFLVASTRYITGFADREVREIILVPLTLLGLLFRCRPTKEVRPSVSFILYACIGLFVFLRGLEIPNYAQLKPDEVTGFQGRWWIAGSIASFAAGYYFSKTLDLSRFVRVFFFFNATVLIISLLMALLGVDKVPLFNTFTWMKLEGVNRFGILSLSGALSIVTLMSTPEIFRQRWIRRPFYIVAAIGVIAGGGRGDFMGVIVSIMAYAFLVRRKRWQLVITLVALLVFSIVFFVAGVGQLIPEKYSRILEMRDFFAFISSPLSSLDQVDFRTQAESEAAGSTMYRLLVWATAIEGIEEHALLGVGLETVTAAGFSSKSLQVTDVATIAAGNLHNTYLSIAYIWGIPAALLFSLLLRDAFKKTLSLIGEGGEMPFGFFYAYLWFYFILSFSSDIHLMYSFMMVLGIIHKLDRNRSQVSGSSAL